MDAGDSLTILDVRGPDEYGGWNIPGSINMPLDSLDAGASPEVVPGAEVVTVCFSGARSASAQRLLQARGMNVLDLKGGMVAWNSVHDEVTVPQASPGVEVLQFRRIGKGCLSYMVVSGGEALVIDPSMDVDVYVDAAATRSARIVKVLDTHAHADHLSGTRALVSRSGATCHAPDEVGGVPHESIKDGDHVRVGNATIAALHTPGHTAGSMAYRLGQLIFTGDTLFIESVGRPDLGQDPRPNAAVLHRTLHDKVMVLPGDTLVLPGHYGRGVDIGRGQPVARTIESLRGRLAALAMDLDSFTEWVVGNTIPKPPNFSEIKKFNQGLVDLPEDELRELEAGPNRCAVDQ